MKTLMLRVCYLGLAVSTILASPGTEEPANAEPTDPVADVLKPLKIADADVIAESEVPAPLAVMPADTNAPARPPVPLRDKEPVAPPNVQLSPGMTDIVKLVQAGVSPDVLMAYITNSSTVFNVDSDVIVYLNDLGVTNSVITALIQHDSSPETVARKASANAVQPLPPNASTTAPVANVYPPAVQRTVPTGQTVYPGDVSMVTDTNVIDQANPPPAVATAAPAENVSVNYFYNSLSPYGSWVDVPGYGMCWQPTVAVVDPYWRPYSDRGRWLWSDAGWYWYSDYTWGWGPFHYGRWCSYPSYGWIWVPGTVWAPSWVTWRYSAGYCGWAPLPPGCGYRSGIGLTWYGSGIGLGFDFGLGWNCWSYVPVSHFCDWHVRRHCLPSHGIRVVHNAATPVNRFTTRNNTVMNQGIDPNTIAKATRTKVPTARITDHALPSDARVKPERLDTSGNTLAVVRPQLPKTQPASATPVPSRGTATKARPMTLNGGTAQANANVPSGRQTLAPPRANANNLSTATTVTRDQGTGRNVTTTAPNSANRPTPNQAAPDRSTVTQTPNRPQPSTPTAQTPSPFARNNVTPGGNPAPVGRNLAPPQTQTQPQSAPATRANPQQSAPATRVAPQQSTPGTRVFPQQSAPAAAPRVAPPQPSAPSTRNISPMIRSYANPSTPGPSPLAPPGVRAQGMAPSVPAGRPQFSAPGPSASRPSMSAPAHSAPSVSRSAPSNSGGGGGGGGGRSGGAFGGKGTRD